MKFTFEKKGYYGVLAVSESKLDYSNYSQLETELTSVHEKGTKRLIIDLQAVTFVDSKGLDVLLFANKTFKKLIVVNLASEVARLVKISGLETVITILPALQSAEDEMMQYQLMEEMDDEGNNNSGD